MAIWVVESLSRGYKIRKEMPKNQHTQGKSLNSENWVMVRCQKVPKFDFQNQFSTSFPLKNINLGAHFLLLKFFDNINS